MFYITDMQWLKRRHFVEPRHAVVPRHEPVPGIENFGGFEMHSHNYRLPHSFKDQVQYIFKL